MIKAIRVSGLLDALPWDEQGVINGDIASLRNSNFHYPK